MILQQKAIQAHPEKQTRGDSFMDLGGVVVKVESIGGNQKFKV